MRIINARRDQYDYFDFAVPFVAGDDVVFDRRNVVKFGLDAPPDGICYAVLSEDRYDHDIKIYGVGFCGVLYLYFRYKSGSICPQDNPTSRIIYANSVAELEAQTEPLHRYEKARVERMISLFHKSSKYGSLFIENQTPVFFFGFESYWYPRQPERTDWVLRKIEFERLFNPTQAYQEIELYISNVLNNRQYAPVKLSNTWKLRKAGFDQFSFKHPIK